MLSKILLILFLFIVPVFAQLQPADTGLEFSGRSLYWESTGRPDAMMLSLEALPTESGLTTTESVAIVVKTTAGRYEVIAGIQEDDKFYLKEYIGTVIDPMDAPAMVLGYLIGRKTLGCILQ